MNKIKIDKLIDNDIFQNIDKYDIDEDDVIEFKKKVKLIDKKLKENLKPKTITISSKTHSKIKKYCTELNLNIGEYVSELIMNDINNVIDEPYEDPDKKIERIAKSILNKYDSILYKGLYKTNKLILSEGFEFIGYSKIDGLPIYEIDKLENTEIDKLENNNIKIEKIKSNEVSKDIKQNMILDCFVLTSTKIIYE